MLALHEKGRKVRLIETVNAGAYDTQNFHMGRGKEQQPEGDRRKGGRGNYLFGTYLVLTIQAPYTHTLHQSSKATEGGMERRWEARVEMTQITVLEINYLLSFICDPGNIGTYFEFEI